MGTRTGKIAALAGFAYFASTTVSAAPIFVNAESGTTRPLDGTWEYGCVSPGPGLPDKKEVIVFQDNNVESQLITFTSTNGTSSSGGATTSLGSATVSSFDDLTALGWLLSSVLSVLELKVGKFSGVLSILNMPGGSRLAGNRVLSPCPLFDSNHDIRTPIG